MLAVTVTLACWRVPVLEVRAEGDPGSRLLRLDSEEQFALGWAEPDHEGKDRMRILVLEQANNHLAVVRDNSADEEPGELPIEFDRDRLRLRMAGTHHPTLIYSGGSQLLTDWFPGARELTIRRVRVSVVTAWLSN